MTTVPPAQPGSWHRTQRVLRLAMPSAGEMLLGMLVGLVFQLDYVNRKVHLSPMRFMP